MSKYSIRWRKSCSTLFTIRTVRCGCRRQQQEPGGAREKSVRRKAWTGYRNRLNRSSYARKRTRPWACLDELGDGSRRSQQSFYCRTEWVCTIISSELFRNPFDRPHFVLATTTHAACSKTHGNMFHTIHIGQGDLAFGIVPDPTRGRDFERSKWNVEVSPHARALSLDDIAPIPQNGASRDRYSSLRDTIAALSNLRLLNPIWEPMSDVQVRLKRKLVVNACINPMTAITESSNGALFGNETARFVTKAICDEAAAIFAQEAANGSQPGDFVSPDIEQSNDESSAKPLISKMSEAPRGLRSSELQDEVFRVARRTSLNYSSMLVDLWKGRNTEIEHLNGYLRRLGRYYTVPTPHNDLLYNLIKLKEKVVPAARI